MVTDCGYLKEPDTDRTYNGAMCAHGGTVFDRHLPEITKLL